MRHTLAKSTRLYKESDFDSFFKNPKRIESDTIRIFYKPTDSSRKVAFICAKKLGNSVTRSKLKRKLREVYRLNQHSISEKHNLIFSAKPKLIDTPHKVIESSFIKLLKKESLWVQ